MSCKCNNNHYKSCIQKYNFTVQALTETPAPLNMGSTATLTGSSITDTGAGFSIEKTGTYRITVNLIAATTVAGTMTVQLYFNGNPLADTLRVYPVAVGAKELTIDSLRYFNVPNTCDCVTVQYPVTVVASVADATTNVTEITVNAIKEA